MRPGGPTVQGLRIPGAGKAGELDALFAQDGMEYGGERAGSGTSDARGDRPADC